MRKRIPAHALLACAALALPAFAAQAAEPFAACLAQLRGPALKAGVSGATFDTHTAGLAPDMAVIGLLDAQPEFKTPIWDYMAGLVDDERVADGQAAMARWQAELQRAASRYGVDPATVAAVWGVESNYGRTLGGRPLLVSLSTLSCFGRRQAYFRGEFYATLKIIQDEGMAPERLTGSWAGAFGQTQFMPSTYLRLAVDFDGDGRRDLVDSVPDALASTANFLRKAGYRSGQPWGIEVKLPAGYEGSSSRKDKHDVAWWTARGLTRGDGRPLPQMPPLEARLSAAYDDGTWSAGALWRIVAAQKRYALNEGNVVGKDFGPSAGFGVLSINGGYAVNKQVQLSVGVDNLFDKTYSEHLNLAGNAGFGYAANTAVNEPGRTFWARLSFKY